MFQIIAWYRIVYVILIWNVVFGVSIWYMVYGVRYINIKTSHSGSKANIREIPGVMFYKILAFMWSLSAVVAVSLNT